MVVAPKIEGTPSDEKSFMPCTPPTRVLICMFNPGLLSQSPSGHCAFVSPNLILVANAVEWHKIEHKCPQVKCKINPIFTSSSAFPRGTCPRDFGYDNVNCMELWKSTSTAARSCGAEPDCGAVLGADRPVTPPAQKATPLSQSSIL